MVLGLGHLEFDLHILALLYLVFTFSWVSASLFGFCTSHLDMIYPCTPLSLSLQFCILLGRHV